MHTDVITQKYLAQLCLVLFRHAFRYTLTLLTSDTLIENMVCTGTMYYVCIIYFILREMWYTFVIRFGFECKFADIQLEIIF